MYFDANTKLKSIRDKYSKCQKGAISELEKLIEEEINKRRGYS